MRRHGRGHAKRRRKLIEQWYTKGPQCWIVHVDIHGTTGARAEKLMDDIADLVYTRYQNDYVYVGADKRCELEEH